MAGIAGQAPPPRMLFVDSNGKPLAGGQVYSYVPGGNTLAPTWEDPNQAILNTNPINLDSSGTWPIYIDGTVDLVAFDYLGNPVQGASGNTTNWPVSTAMGPVVGAESVQAAAELLQAQLASPQIVQSFGSNINLTTNLPEDVAQITLTPGFWLVSGTCFFAPGAGISIVGLGVTITMTPNALTGYITQQLIFTDFVGSNTNTLSVGCGIVQVVEDTIYYITAYGQFSGGTLEASGNIVALQIA